MKNLKVSQQHESKMAMLKSIATGTDSTKVSIAEWTKMTKKEAEERQEFAASNQLIVYAVASRLMTSKSEIQYVVDYFKKEKVSIVSFENGSYQKLNKDGAYESVQLPKKVLIEFTVAMTKRRFAVDVSKKSVAALEILSKKEGEKIDSLMARTKKGLIIKI